MKLVEDPCVRVGVLSAGPLPRSGGGAEASSWVVEAKVSSSSSRARCSLKTRPAGLARQRNSVSSRCRSISSINADAGTKGTADVAFNTCDASSSDGCG